ncbi:MAG: transporter substrate-binding domain-containing protein [Mycobacterium sp.]|nr:transporter substrate-binding domain-containing protein [Mycobacterium sp.]
MGEVYRARDTKTDRIVALKLLPPHLANDEAFQRRFRRESQAAAGVNDPHVVPIHGYGEIDNRLYLDMRLIEGRNLGTILANRKQPLGVEAAAVVVEQVASALDAAHKQGLVHRDVKPSNILVSDNDFVYLIDFGLARTTSDPGMTTAGNTLGTLAYMAPERFSGGQSDTRSDIYALTCVLYECLTGSRPYPSDSLEQQIAGHMVTPPPRPSDHEPTLAAFDSVIAKGMAKDPERRYQTGAELAAAVRKAMSSPRVRARRRRSAHRALASSPRSTLRRAMLMAGLGALLVAVFAIGAWQLRGAADKSAPTPGAEPTDAAGAVPALAATVPADIKSAGSLIIGVNMPYAPNEFRDSFGQIVGFDVDLMNAVTRTLGLKPDYREVPFDSIIPSVQAADLNVGMSSLTDTKDREGKVDFVTYYQAGILWAQRVGPPIDPANACGLRVGVAAGGLPETEDIPAKSAACVAAGQPAIQMVVYDRQDELTKALIAGDVDAMSADSPVTGFAVKTSGGALIPAGEVFGAGPYGWPVAKGSPLAESLRQALEHLIATGEYRTIATVWGVEKGMIDKPVVNGAIR